MFKYGSHHIALSHLIGLLDHDSDGWSYCDLLSSVGFRLTILKHTNENRTPLVLTLGYHKKSQTGWAVLRDSVLEYGGV